LGAALTAGAEEGAGVLEVARGGVGREGLHGGERRAVAREDVADLALRDGDERRGVDAVLQRREDVPAAAEHVGLGFAAK
jgi:plasmid stabilization system protein ParE